MGISNKQLEANMKNFLDKRVLIINGHKDEGKEGVTARVCYIKGYSKPVMVVKLDDGSESIIKNNKHILFIVQKINANYVNKN
jgi:hypothetical protein